MSTKSGLDKRRCIQCCSQAFDETGEDANVVGRYTGEFSLRTKETWWAFGDDLWAHQHEYGDHHGEFDEHKRWLDTPRPHALFKCPFGHEWWVQGKEYEEVVD